MTGWPDPDRGHADALVAARLAPPVRGVAGTPQTLRTRIFLSLADDPSAQIASTLCSQVGRMKASYAVSGQARRAGASMLSGSADGGASSVGASKAFSERREPPFHPQRLRPAWQLPSHRPFPTTAAARSTRRRGHPKPDFLPRERPHWRAREAGQL